ncbi:MAG: dUTP diphosphatase [Cellvibrionales bacterium]|jgi:dimeric dUTPase (all-alpha-NTP-PPase superfamily)|nr:dUTP diphosphatase [Cellvibrionales bacterium]MBK8675529.1 dUTP diphosphatase [Cellvibrionales bacterium]TXH51354.1 MAG: dUTP diphosphatase [Cellvibrionales bacterium]
MQAQILTMLTLQDSMNCKVHPQWREQGYEWYRAIWVECAELMDHYGWKWWKKQQPDVEQVQLELIDIFHFGLSSLLAKNIPVEQLSVELETALRVRYEKKEFRLALEDFVQLTLNQRGFNVDAFVQLMASAELGFDALYRGYVGKNVLNFFRQDNGYKDGSYIKNWAGREDNEHLVDLMASLDAGSQNFKDDLYAGLSQRYRELVAEA